MKHKNVFISLAKVLKHVLNVKMVVAGKRQSNASHFRCEFHFLWLHLIPFCYFQGPC